MAMFHGTLHFETSESMKGRVLGFEIGSIGLSRGDRAVRADISEWDDCLACAEFDHCCRSCVAKLALAGAISES